MKPLESAQVFEANALAEKEGFEPSFESSPLHHGDGTHREGGRHA